MRHKRLTTPLVRWTPPLVSICLQTASLLHHGTNNGEGYNIHVLSTSPNMIILTCEHRGFAPVVICQVVK
jgi:hypothetical protein